jgi:hypothetical protein
MALDEEDQDDEIATAELDEDGSIEKYDPEDWGFEETDDGGAIIKFGSDEEEEEPDFFENLAETIPENELSTLATDLIEFIEGDIESRKPRDDKYSEGIKRTGLGDEAPGGEAFDGASQAVHPMLSKATVYYQSHTINELMPPRGPVRDEILGTPTPARVAKAGRKVRHMNWQFLVQMPEFRPQLEKLLSQQPLGGSMYLRLVYDSTKKRPVPMFFSIDDVFIPQGASDFYSAERRTVQMHITQNEFERRVRSGYYKKTRNISPPVQLDDESSAQKATDKVQGLDRSAINKDGDRKIYIVECLAEIEDTDKLRLAGDRPHDANWDPDEEADKMGPLPYLIEIDVHSQEIMSIVRNWEEDDELHENMCWIIDFPFIPWDGAQSVGLVHLAGSLAGAGTGALRALLDSALVNNLPTAIKLKGSGMAGQSITLNIGQLTEIEGGVGAKDIREVIMPLPFNPPSAMLFQLLGWCTEQGEELVRTTFEGLEKNSGANMPVGTTLALIEQGLTVLSAIHMRLHGAMNRVIGVLHRINRLYITDDEIEDDTGERLALHSDYEGPVDVVPVSDPQVFSDVQRFAQLQIVQQRADLHPELYDARKVEKLILERTRLPNAVDLLKPEPKIEELNQVNENLAMVLGRPVTAFPEQDHLAHIQVLLDFMTSPVLGQLPIIAPTFMPAALTHLKEHIAYWYVTHVHELTSAAAGQDMGDIAKIKDKEVSQEMDRTLAAASKRVVQGAAKVFQQIPQIVQQALQLVHQFSQGNSQIPMDPNMQAKIASDERVKTQDIQAKTQTAQQNNQARLQQTAIQQQGEDQRTAAEIQSKEQINSEDNSTALEIAAAKIETGHSTNLETGTGINPNP